MNGPKWVQNGPKWPILGPFWAFSGHLGLLAVILYQYAAAGASHAHNVPPNVEILAFLASFRAILAVLGQFLPHLGPFWALFRPFWSLFDLVVSSPWWQALEFEAI